MNDIPDFTGEDKKTFLSELEILINRFSKENGSNTPDFLLAMYLNDCLKAYDRAVTSRDKLKTETAMEELNKYS